MKQNRILHDTGIPLIAYEYHFPLTEIPPEADEQWGAWLTARLHRDASEIKTLLRIQFETVSPELAPLRDRLLAFEPSAIVIFQGTPILWLRNPEYFQRDFIYLHPQSTQEEVRLVLQPFQLGECELLIEFLALFGGLGERYPWEEVYFSGERSRGKTRIYPAQDSILAGEEWRSEAENQLLRDRFAPWLDGFQLADTGDGGRWHVAADGTVLQQECGMQQGAYVASFSEVLKTIVGGMKPDSFFAGVHRGLQNAITIP